MLGLQDGVVEAGCPHLLLLIIIILGSRREDGHSVQPAQARQVIFSALVLNKIIKDERMTELSAVATYMIIIIGWPTLVQLCLHAGCGAGECYMVPGPETTGHWSRLREVTTVPGHVTPARPMGARHWARLHQSRPRSARARVRRHGGCGEDGEWSPGVRRITRANADTGNIFPRYKNIYSISIITKVKVYLLMWYKIYNN